MTAKPITQEMIDAGNAALDDMTARNKVGLGGEVVVAVFNAMMEASNTKTSNFTAQEASNQESAVTKKSKKSELDK